MKRSDLGTLVASIAGVVVIGFCAIGKISKKPTAPIDEPKRSDFTKASRYIRDLGGRNVILHDLDPIPDGQVDAVQEVGIPHFTYIAKEWRDKVDLPRNVTDKTFYMSPDERILLSNVKNAHDAYDHHQAEFYYIRNK